MAAGWDPALPTPSWDGSRQWQQAGVLLSPLPAFSAHTGAGALQGSPHQPPARLPGAPFPRQPQWDTEGSFWAVPAPPVRAADNTPSHGRAYQHSAATASRANKGKCKGCSHAGKLASLELCNSPKPSVNKKIHSRFFTEYGNVLSSTSHRCETQPSS